MSRYSNQNHATGVQASAVEDLAGERDPLRSIDNVRIYKFKIVVDGETIYEYGSEEE